MAEQLCDDDSQMMNSSQFIPAASHPVRGREPFFSGEVSKWSQRGSLKNRLSERVRGFESKETESKQIPADL